MKLFQITHHTGDTLMVAAEDIKRVTEVYEPYEIKLLNSKVVVIRARDTDHYDSETVKELKRILQIAIDSEERHYESDDTKSGWIDEAKQLLA